MSESTIEWIAEQWILLKSWSEKESGLDILNILIKPLCAGEHLTDNWTDCLAEWTNLWSGQIHLGMANFCPTILELFLIVYTYL